jgi:hypothetical protein
MKSGVRGSLIVRNATTASLASSQGRLGSQEGVIGSDASLRWHDGDAGASSGRTDPRHRNSPCPTHNPLGYPSRLAKPESRMFANLVRRLILSMPRACPGLLARIRALRRFPARFAGAGRASSALKIPDRGVTWRDLCDLPIQQAGVSARLSPTVIPASSRDPASSFGFP